MKRFNDKPVSAKVMPDLAKKIEQTALALGISPSEVIRRAIALGLPVISGEVTVEEIKSRC